MQTGVPFRHWLLLPISIVLVVVPFTFTANLWDEIYQGPLLADLNAARQRWETHPIAHYLMTIEREQAARRRCRQRIEVLEEKIARVLDDNCSTPLMTVTDLFDMLKQNLAPEDCTGDACQCMKPYRASPLYDKQHGYPSTTLLVPIQTYAEPADAEFWGQAPGMNRQMDCASGPLMYETITVTELKPLP